MLDSYYGNEDIAKSEREESYIPFRKIKLSSYVNQVQTNKRLSKNLRKKSGNDCVLVLGDWSTSRAKFYEPISGQGMRKTLKKEGFELYLINEYKTSSICPDCGSELENFKEFINPRPYQCLKDL